jgi:hypothetical protein
MTYMYLLVKGVFSVVTEQIARALAGAGAGAGGVRAGAGGAGAGEETSRFLWILNALLVM